MANETTYFENPLEFKYKIIDPDSKKIGYLEQNKDLVTTFFKENKSVTWDKVRRPGY